MKTLSPRTLKAYQGALKAFLSTDTPSTTPSESVLSTLRIQNALTPHSEGGLLGVSHTLYVGASPGGSKTF